MPYVVTENCQQCRFTDCVTVCPVDAFHGDAEMLYIDPDACIDCGACEPQCPVKAIKEDREAEKNPALAKWVGENREKSAGLPLITKKTTPLPTAEAKKKSLGY
jgi:ferredoxin